MNRRSLLRTMAGGTCGSLVLPSLAALEPGAAASSDDTPAALRRLRDARWSEEKAFRYMQQFGEIKGCNYVPSDGSSIMTSPNEELIRRELGWARDVAGLNCVRVWIDLADFQINADQLHANFEKFLKACDENRIKVLLVLSMQSALDPGVSPAAAAMSQPTMDFHPSVHGGGLRYPDRIHWPCCEPEGAMPAKAAAAWEQTKPAAEKFFRTFLTRYKNDERILLWDLYNEAPKSARPYVEILFEWAREAGPSQPLSVCWQGHDLSDVITFHTYARPGFETANRNNPGWDFLNELDWARAWGRPMLCTEWLARPFGNTIAAILPFFARYHIGWFVWGLCAVGPAQYQFPWDWPMGSPPPREWFHCLLYPDGTPYSAEEILAIREFRYRELPPQVMTQSYWRSWKIDINRADQIVAPEPTARIDSQLTSGKA